MIWLTDRATVLVHPVHTTNSEVQNCDKWLTLDKHN